MIESNRPAITHRKPKMTWRATVAMLALSTGLALLGSDRALAADAEQTFNELYGAQLKQVRASASRDDDLALAKQLMAVSADVKDAKVVAVMARNALDLAERHPEGTQPAMEAIEALLLNAPDKSEEWRRRQMVLLNRAFGSARGDAKFDAGEALAEAMIDQAEALEHEGEISKALGIYRKALSIATRIKSELRQPIRDAIELQTARSIASNKVKALKRKVTEKPDDTKSARELVRLLAIDMDRPVEAAAFAIALPDSEKSVVAAMSKDPSEITDTPTLFAVAEWLSSNVDSSKPIVQLPVLHRAKLWFETFVENYEGGGLEGAKAAAMIKQIDTRIAKIEASRPKPKGRYKTFDGNPLTLEAERADAIMLPMIVLSSRDASKGKYVIHPATKRGVPSQGRIIFLIEATEDFTIEVHGRVHTPRFTRNELRVGVAHGKKTHIPERSYGWYMKTSGAQWIREKHSYRFELKKGLNSLIIQGEDFGVGIDQIQIRKYTLGRGDE